MKPKAEALKSELIDKLTKMVEERLPAGRAATSQSFLRQFYANVAPQDLLDEDPEDLFGAALTMWAFARDRKPGAAKVRAYNPRFEEAGWQSAHTVIEIVNDDMPFLVDSVTAALSQLDLTVHLVIHPIIRVTRDAKGAAGKLLEPGTEKKDMVVESIMHLQVSEQSSAQALQRIVDTMEAVLSDVRSAVEDWRTMRAKMLEVIDTVEALRKRKGDGDIAEICDFLRWIEDNHFTFLGYREYDYVGTGKAARMQVVENKGLGVLRDPEVSVFDGLRPLGMLPPDVRDMLLRPEPLLILKANRMSTVHRSVQLDVIMVKKIDAKGKVVGEHRFVGLFTSVAYHQSPREIPLLRQKVNNILNQASFGASSHAGKAMVNILETYPRDELFQSTEEQLYRAAMGILHLQERQRTALFFRVDAFERFVSCVVYVPRERYNTQLRENMCEITAKAFNGEVSAFYTHISESVLAQVHLIVRTTRGEVPEVDPEVLEAVLVDASRSWSDKLHEALIEIKGEEEGNRLFRGFGAGFPSFYRERFTAPAAVFDIERMDRIAAGAAEMDISLSQPLGAEDNKLELKFFHTGKPVALSDVMPVLEDMGVRVINELPYEISVAEHDDPVWLHVFEMELEGDSEVDLTRIRQPFQDAFSAVWTGAMEDDGFNQLVLKAGLTWRQVTVLRAYAKYLRQAAFTFSQSYMEETLAAYPAIARLLVELFITRFDPEADDRRMARSDTAIGRILEALEEVANLDQDRILRRFLNLIQSTQRTNFFQPAEDGSVKSYISFKLDSQAIEDLPLPRPLVEIWVYSPRVEAVHLRGGRVARGGIRWSDRREDFRTEILGLMKAQQVKNAVIVPVGSKGGFVVKRPPTTGGREAFQTEGIECYKIMMRGLLDITDNFSGAEVIPPASVVRMDDDDPYLVVAADKGTATFSDIANGVSEEYGFWLGDAFASGGSAGYDHKGMGITARGGWESVKRHFREIGVNTQTTDFTCVGVGDMSGDVFGNGMLLSKHIRLIAAFNHLHVFVDPDPDPAKGWAERKRLFDLPRSSWSDYDPKLISKGGGIFDRSAKSVELTPEIQTLTGLESPTVTPSELIQALLRAEVDLLWFGGIGTYIKGSDESHADAGDRANDVLRIDGREVRAKVVGEGANLGVTHLGRIEFALAGGRINTDAIDNSAGVDCSDHEVNIKILLGAIVDNGDMTPKQRDKLLEAMTDDVAEHVLKDNYDQTQALTMAFSEGVGSLDAHSRLMRQLERSHVRLDRRIEFLPDDETIAERATSGIGLTRPELAVLLAYAKMELYDELLDSDLPDDPRMVDDLERYFPRRLKDDHADQIARHRLRREIIATYVTNSMINRVGANFVASVREQTGDGAPDIARAYIIARDVFDVRGLWGRVEELDNKVPAVVQNRMLMEIRRLVERIGVWFLRNERRPLDLATMAEDYTAGVAELRGCLDQVLSDFDRRGVDKAAAEYQKHGVPADLAREVASADVMVSGCDIVRLARQIGESVEDVSRIYFSIGARFSLDWLRERAEALSAESHWQKLAISAVVDDLFNHQVVLAHSVIDAAKASGGAKATGKGKPKRGAKANGDGGPAIEGWLTARRDGVERTTQLLADLKGCDEVDLAMLAVANGQIRSLLAR